LGVKKQNKSKVILGRLMETFHHKHGQYSF